MRLWMLTAVTAWCGAVPAVSTAQIHGDALQFSPAGRQVSAWLAVFNHGTPDDMRRFLLNHAPSQFDVLDRMIALRQRTGGFDTRKIVLSKDTRVTLLLQERGSDQFAGITMDVEGWVPHRITRLSIGLLERPPEFAIRRLSEAQLVDSLRAKLADSAATDRFAGAVLLARAGREVFAGAGGWADRERGVATSAETRFRLGSMNRMFTAVAILQLVQAGMVRLDAPVTTYLADQPDAGAASRITIHELLTNTAVIGDAPGQDGYALLAAVIDQVSGTSHHDYLRTRVFEPAGMLATGFEPGSASDAGLAVGYTRPRATSPWMPATTSSAARAPANSGYSTVRDMLRFANALARRMLLDSAHTELLMSGKVDTRAGRYAYGLYDGASSAGRRIWSRAGAPGVSVDFEMLPVADYVVVVLSNLDPPAARIMSDYVLSRLPIARSR